MPCDNFLKISLTYEAAIARYGLRWAMQYAAPRYAKGRLCDLGCGTKPYESFFAPHITEYVGVDHPSSAALHAKSATKADVWCDCAGTPITAGSFNTVLSTQTLEHVPSAEALVKEMYRILAPGGTVIVTMPFCWSVHAPPYDFRRLTEFGLRSLFETHGFTTAEILPCQGLYATIKQLEIIYLKHTRRGIKGFTKYISVPLRNVMAILFDRKRDTSLCLDYLGIFHKIT